MRKYVVLIPMVTLFLFVCNKGLSQEKKTEIDKFELWNQRITMGLNYSVPKNVGLNFGMKFKDKIYVDFLIELASSKKHRLIVSGGYQQNYLFNKKLHGQIGIAWMQVPNKSFTDKVNLPGLNVKLIKTLSERIDLFLGATQGLQNKNVHYNQTLSVNIGFNYSFKSLPFLFY